MRLCVGECIFLSHYIYQLVGTDLISTLICISADHMHIQIIHVIDLCSRELFMS